jgi:hypothetical protein
MERGFGAVITSRDYAIISIKRLDRGCAAPMQHSPHI